MTKSLLSLLREMASFSALQSRLNRALDQRLQCLMKMDNLHCERVQLLKDQLRCAQFHPPTGNPPQRPLARNHESTIFKPMLKRLARHNCTYCLLPGTTSMPPARPFARLSCNYCYSDPPPSTSHGRFREASTSLFDQRARAATGDWDTQARHPPSHPSHTSM